MTDLPSLLLLPGLGCDGRLWAAQVEGLNDLARVTCVELPDADGLAAMAEGVLAGAPPRFALAGLSMGGYLAFEILRQAPRRVERLALLDTQAGLDPVEVQRARRIAMLQLEGGGFEAHVEERLSLLLGPRAQQDAGVVALTRQMALKVGAARYRRQMQAILDRPDSRPGLAAIDCPTLVLCGREDALTPVARHEEIAAAVPGARLELLGDCGHLSTLEQPDAVTAQLRGWLGAEL